MTLVRPGGELLGDLRHSPENISRLCLFRWDLAFDKKRTGELKFDHLSSCNYTVKVETEKLW